MFIKNNDERDNKNIIETYIIYSILS